MENSFKEAKSMNQIRDFMQQSAYLIDEKNTAFIDNLANNWDEGLLSQKLIELNERELAKQIDAINPNQSGYDICKEIYQILLRPQKEDAHSINEEPFKYDIGESMISDIEWCVPL